MNNDNDLKDAEEEKRTNLNTLRQFGNGMYGMVRTIP